MTEYEMVRWHHRLNGHDFGQTARDNEEQGSLVCCSLWGHKESDTTERPNGTYSCTGLSEWKSIWPSWCTTSTPATMITC